MTIKKNGNGTYTISKWYWNVRTWVVYIAILIFSLGGAWALVNYKTNQNTSDITFIKDKIGKIELKMGTIETDIGWIKRALGYKE